MTEVRRGNKTKALELLGQMLKLNPADPYAKFSQKDLKYAITDKSSPQNQRLKVRAKEYVDSGQWEKAANILNVIDALPNGRKDPEVVASRRMINDLMAFEREANRYQQAGDWKNLERTRTLVTNRYPEATKSSILNPVSRPAVGPKTGPIYYAFCTVALEKAATESVSCNFPKAQATLTTARKQYIECRQDARLTRRLTTLGNLEQNLYIISSLKPDISKRDVVTQAYGRALKLAPNCVRPDYFDYVHKQAMVNKNNGNCAQAIILFSQAKRISPSLAKRYRLDEEILVQTDTCNCRELGKVLLSGLQQADRLYRSCECDSAIIAWKEAEKYLCSTNLTGKANWEAWRDKVADCEMNGVNTKRFATLITQAADFFMADLCKEAQQRYQSADSLQVRCGALNKGGIKSALAKCQQCIQKQRFDSTFAKAEHSRLTGFERDALTNYRKALAYNPPADKVPQLNEIIRRLECKFEKVNCPPDTLISVVKKHLTKFSLMGGGNLIFPELVSTTNPVKNVTGWYGYSGGVRFDNISLKSPISFGASVAYTSILIYGLDDDLQYANEQFSFNYAEANIMLKLHSPKQYKGRIRPYLHGGLSILIPVSYQYQNNISNIQDNTLKALAGTVKLPKGGLGVEWQKPRFGLAIEGYYGSFADDLFISPTQQTTNKRGYTSPLNRIIGVTLGLRFW